MANQTAPRKLSRLESIPGELLNRIFHYAVVNDEAVVAVTPIDGRARTWQINTPALAATCKQFREDVLPIYYAENAFTFERTCSGWEYAMETWYDNAAPWQHLITRVGGSVVVEPRIPGIRAPWTTERHVTATVNSNGLLTFDATTDLPQACMCELREALINPKIRRQAQRFDGLMVTVIFCKDIAELGLFRMTDCGTCRN